MKLFLHRRVAVVFLILATIVIWPWPNAKSQSSRHLQDGWRRIDDHIADVGLTSLAINPTGERLIVASAMGPENRGVLFLHDLRAERRNRYQFESTGGVYSVAFSPDGKTFAIGTWRPLRPDAPESGSLILRETESGKRIWSHNAVHRSNLYTLDFSPDGKTIATGGWDDSIKLWETSAGKLLGTLPQRVGSVYCVSYSPDGRYLASARKPNSVTIWDVATSKELQNFKEHSKPVYTVAFAPNGKTLASGGADNSIRFWDLESGKQTRLLSGHKHEINSLAFSPSGHVLASASVMKDASVKLWNADDGTLLRTLDADRIVSIEFLNNGKTLISARETGAIQFWNIKTGELLRILKTEGDKPR